MKIKKKYVRGKCELSQNRHHSAEFVNRHPLRNGFSVSDVEIALSK
jgi:hypothetical protein